MRVAWAFAWAVFSALFTAHSVRQGAGTFPDSLLFASGRACWSSGVACTAGKVAGRDGVMYVSALGSAGVVYWIARLAGIRGVLLLFLCALTPVGWPLFVGGADSVGALAVVLAMGGRYRGVGGALVGVVHLAAGFVCVGAVLLRRLGVKRSYAYLLSALGFGEAVALYVHGLLFAHPGYLLEFQWRYMLPGAVFVCARYAVSRERSSAKVVYAS